MLSGETFATYVSGSYRIQHPRTLLDAVRPLLHVAGVTRLANITGLDRIGIPVVLAIRPQAPSLSACAGKGISLDDAVASAAMEAIEFHCAESICPSPAGRQLQADAPRISPTQGLPQRSYAIVSDPAASDWLSGTDLLNDEAAAVPFDAVTLGEPRALASPLRQTSNGLASGAVVVEAVLAALLELVERDALAVWHRLADRTGVQPPRLDTGNLYDCPRAESLVRQIEEASVTPLVYDCTVDTLIPVYMVRLVDGRERGVGIFRGSGAHVDPEVALVRALTEAAQSRAVYISGSRDDLSPREFAQLRAQDSSHVAARLLGQPQTARFRTSRVVDQPRTSLETQCRRVLGRLADVGCERVVAIDLTPEMPPARLAVVRVLAPGLAASGVADQIIERRAEALTRLLAA